MGRYRVSTSEMQPSMFKKNETVRLRTTFKELRWTIVDLKLNDLGKYVYQTKDENGKLYKGGAWLSEEYLTSASMEDLGRVSLYLKKSIAYGAKSHAMLKAQQLDVSDQNSSSLLQPVDPRDAVSIGRRKSIDEANDAESRPSRSSRDLKIGHRLPNPFAQHASKPSKLKDLGYFPASPLSKKTYPIAIEVAAHLLEHHQLRALLTDATKMEKREDVLQSHLSPPIRFFGRQLEMAAGNAQQLSAASELKNHASFIARALVSRMHRSHLGEDEDEKTRTQRGARIGTLLVKQSSPPQIGLRNSPTQIRQAEDLIDLQESTELTLEKPPNLKMSKNALEEVKRFIVSNRAFHSFLYLLCRMLYSTPLEAVEKEIRRSFARFGESSSNLLSATFNIPSDLSSFLSTEANNRMGTPEYSQLSTLLVVSGTPRACFATSCAEYLGWQWPVTRDRLLMVISNEQQSGSRDTSNDSELSIVRLHQHTHIKARGTIEFLTEIGQQITWLAAAFRKIQDKEVSISEVLFYSASEGNFQISTLPLKKISVQDEKCWATIFPGTVIAHEYPTPKRGVEIGIEVPFHFIMTLVGPLYPMSLDGGVYFKGFSRLLFPTAVSEDGSIQWHLISSRGSDNPIEAGAIHQQKWIKIRSPSKLAQARTFLGYCRQIVVDLGTNRPAEYYRNILFSGLRDEQHAPAIGMPSSLTAGTGGLPFNVGMTIPITKPKALVHAMDNERDYMDVLEIAKDRPVIIYDTDVGSARGWMVPALSVILHMIHSWSAKYGSFSKEFPHAEVVTKTGDAVRDVLLSRWSFVLRKTSDEALHKDKLVRDLVMQYWDGLVQRRLHDLEAMSQVPPQKEFTFKKLYGWDYMDIVVDKHSRRQQIDLEANWGRFSEECTIIFGKQFGSLIRPAARVQLCSKWDPIPTKKMFLTATIRCLEVLAYERGGSSGQLTSSRLTNKGYWHYEPKELFADCRDCYNGQRCRKVPQCLHSSAQEDNGLGLVPPSEGAVVFGKEVRKLQRHAAARERNTEAPRNASKGLRWANRLVLKARLFRNVSPGKRAKGSGASGSSLTAP